MKPEVFLFFFSSLFTEKQLGAARRATEWVTSFFDPLVSFKNSP